MGLNASAASVISTATSSPSIETSGRSRPAVLPRPCRTIFERILVQRHQEAPGRALGQGVRAAEPLERLDRLKHARQGARHGKRFDRGHQSAGGRSYHLVLPSGPHHFPAPPVYSMAELDDDVICVVRAFGATRRRSRVSSALRAGAVLRGAADARELRGCPGRTQNAFVRAYEGLDTDHPNRRFSAGSTGLRSTSASTPGGGGDPTIAAGRTSRPRPARYRSREAENAELSGGIDSALVRLSEDAAGSWWCSAISRARVQRDYEAVGAPGKT